MLYLPPGTSVPERIHGAFVDDHEVHAVIEEIKKSGAPNYIYNILEESPMPVMPGESIRDSNGEEIDPLYDEAVAVVTETRKASISYVQRRLKIGYNRAARMIEEMETAGVVSLVQSNGSREVLAPPPPTID
jgi:S-DNA-T family DNA segregation ATPase FtsK/SpoIIIE